MRGVIQLRNLVFVAIAALLAANAIAGLISFYDAEGPMGSLAD